MDENFIASLEMKNSFKCLLFLLLLLENIFSFSQTRKIDSLKNVLQIEKIDTSKLKLLNKISKQFFSIGSYDSSLFYAGRSKSFAENCLCVKTNTGDSVLRTTINRELTIALNMIGINNRFLGNFPLALQALAQGMKVAKENENLRGEADAYNNTGLVYYEQGDFPNAIKNFFSCLAIREKMKDQLGVAYCNANIGLVNLDQGNYQAALNYHLAAMKIFSAMNNQNGIAGSILNMANVYVRENKFDQAFENYNAALKIDEALGNLDGVSAIYDDMAAVYYLEKKYPEALENYLLDLEIKEKMGDKNGIANAEQGIGDVYLSQKKYGQARNYLSKSLQLSLAIGSKVVTQACYVGLAKADSIAGDFAHALSNYKLSILYRDSLNNEENTKKTVQTQMQYDFDKKSSADSIKNFEEKKRDDLKHDQEIQQQKIYSYGGAIGFLLMLIVAIVSIRAFRNKQKANEIISHQKSLVEEKQKEILDSIHYAKRIQKSLMPTEKYIQRNIDRLKKTDEKNN